MNWFCANLENLLTESLSLLIVFRCAYITCHYRTKLRFWEQAGLYGLCMTFLIIILSVLGGVEERPLWTKLFMRGIIFALTFKWIYELKRRRGNPV